MECQGRHIFATTCTFGIRAYLRKVVSESDCCSRRSQQHGTRRFTWFFLLIFYSLSCFYHIRDLWRVHLDDAKLLATALASHCLDYCNSPLYGITDTDLTKLQCVQNQLVHVVTKSPPFTWSVPLLHSLHWLPVIFRILFKISLLTYKILHDKKPAHFHSMLAASLPSCSLRSKKKKLVFWSLWSRPTQVQDHFTLASLLFETCHNLSV